MNNQPWSKTTEYERLKSQKRRAAARAAGKCIICKKQPATRGTYGKRNVPYKTCKTCRTKMRDLMADRRKHERRNE